MPIFEKYEPEPVPFADHTDEELVSVLRSVAMYSPEDELNCGGCGYDSCREFARAFLNGKAERSMCTAYMRKLAQKKANALMTKMPAAVVIVDADLKIIECNPSFIRMFVDRTQISTENNPGLEGVELESVVPFSSLFNSVLETGTDIVDRDIRHRKGTIHASIFTIEKNAVAGAILEDITEPSVRKEQIIKRARQVIEQNLKTVQQIAFLDRRKRCRVGNYVDLHRRVVHARGRGTRRCLTPAARVLSKSIIARAPRTASSFPAMCFSRGNSRRRTAPSRCFPTAWAAA